MNSLIAWTASRLIVPLIAVVSVYMLVRGHDAPGGGFIAALIAGAAIVLRRFLEAEVRTSPGAFVPWMAAGLGLAVLAGLLAIPITGSFLGPRIWYLHLPLGVELKLTWSFLFDVGVYLVVIAVLRAVIEELGARR